MIYTSGTTGPSKGVLSSYCQRLVDDAAASLRRSSTGGRPLSA